MSMHPVLTRYFAFVDAINNGGIKPGKKPHEGLGAVYTCPPCYAEQNWDEKLGVILAEQGVNLEEFAKAHFATFGGNMFIIKDGKLKFREKNRCVSLETLLRTAAEFLPTS